jgi:hypothetical protein
MLGITLRENIKKESERTRIHIPLYAIHSHIYFKFFDEKRLKKDVQRANYSKIHKRV